MKKVSENFRNALKGIREVDCILSYISDENYYVLTTEGSNDILTESNELLATQKGPVIYKAESINNISYNCNVNLLKTICKYIQLDCQYSIPKKTSLNLKIGVKVDDKYEYLDYGNYLIIDEPEYKLDSKSYVITAYDKMVESMVSYDDNPLNVTYPISIKNYLIEICKHFKWNYNLDSIVNGDKLLTKELFLGQKLTYRDILDNISQVIAGNLLFDNDTLKIKYIENYSDNDFELTDTDLRDTNVSIAGKYGPVNSLLITTNKNVVLNNLIDESSVSQNGKIEFQIDDNYILNYDSDNFIQEIFNKVKNVEYYLYDLDNIGILILEPLDNFKVYYDEKKYNTLLLNDNIKLTTGLIENIYADKPSIDVSEYIPNNKIEKDLNDAKISIDKANSQVVIKATSDGKLVQAELIANASEGSQFNVKADNINLEGYTTINGGFSVDENGNILANNGTFSGGKVTLNDDGKKNGARLILNSSNGMNKILSNQMWIMKDENNFLTLNAQDYYYIWTSNDNGNAYLGNNGNGATMYLKDYETSAEIKMLVSRNDNPYIKVEKDASSTSISQNGVWSPSFNNTSIEEVKKNIEKLKSNAIKLISDTDLYNYNYKDETNKDKKHIGIVIGNNYNYAKEILSNDGKGVDLYSMISLAWQAIKEQQEQIETMQKSYSFFTEKISKLESILKILGGKNE